MAKFIKTQNSLLISIIMIDGGFRENFSSLNSWLDQSLSKDEYEIIWVDYTDRVANQISSNNFIRSYALNRKEERQILAYCYNEGIKQAKGEIIVIPDADVICERNLLEIIAEELTNDPDEVLYVLRLDQPQQKFINNQSDDYIKRTCSIKHTYNYGGCTGVQKKWLIKMNGYEQLPIFAGYHYNGGDNYIRFKNMGLKIRWHPDQRVYHAWHNNPPSYKFETVKEQEDFIRRRAASWDWLAYDGINPELDRSYSSNEKIDTEWSSVTTERGTYKIDEKKVDDKDGDKINYFMIIKRFVKRFLSYIINPDGK